MLQHMYTLLTSLSLSFPSFLPPLFPFGGGGGGGALSSLPLLCGATDGKELGGAMGGGGGETCN